MSLNRHGHRRFSAEPSRAAVPKSVFAGAAVIVRADAKIEQAVLFEVAATSVAGGWRRVQCGQLLCERDDARGILPDGFPVNDAKRQRRFQFSMRKLLVVVVLLSLPLAWLSFKIRKAERQRQAVEAIRQAGGVVLYDYEFKAIANQYAELEAESPEFSVNVLSPKPEPPAPEWLLGLLGVDFFSDVAGVDLTRTHATKERIEEFEKALPNCDILRNSSQDQPLPTRPPIRCERVDGPVNDAKRQRRFQFSLRKLLLWMAVLGVYLGVLRLITANVSVVLISICWLAVIVAVRLKWGARRGSTVAVAGTGFCLSVIFVAMSHPLEEMIFGVLVGALFGAVLGLLGSFVAERSIRFVDFLDGLMQTKTPHDDTGENHA